MFGEMIPQSAWDDLVNKEFEKFIKNEAKPIIQEVIKGELIKLILETLKEPQYQERWKNNRHMSGDMVEKIVKEMAPDMVALLFGGISEQVIQTVRNQLQSMVPRGGGY